MSSVWEVTSVSIDGQQEVNTASSVREVVIQPQALDVPNIDVTTNTERVVEVQTAGPQGRPGLQNVYVGPTNPATLYGWGQEQKDFIWVRTQS